MRTVIIIPARYASQRFPGKPLTMIAGKPMLKRVWELAKAVKAVDEVYVATDDDRIADAAKSYGAQVVMTPEDCENGTERAYEAVKNISPKPDIIINFQGDAVLTPPWILQALVDTMQKDASVQYCTPAWKMTREQYKALAAQKAQGSSSGTMVTFDKKGDALYFTKGIIPFLRKAEGEDLPLYRHVGIYAYTFKGLENYLKLEPGVLEQIEGLEQLRVLENGHKMRVVEVDYRGRSHSSVDRPEDVAEVEEIIAREGELLDAKAA